MIEQILMILNPLLTRLDTFLAYAYAMPAVLGTVNNILFFAFWMFAVYLLHKGVVAVNSHEPFLRTCRDRLGTGSRGGLTDDEAERTKAKIAELITEWEKRTK